MRKGILGILFLLMPLSPFIWLAMVNNEDNRQIIYIKRHIILLVFIWVIVGGIFGIYGGVIIETLAAFY